MHPKDAEDHYQAGFAAFGRGDFDAAVAALHRALALDPRHVEALRTLAMAYFRQERYSEALAIGERLLEAAPTDVLSHTTLSLLLQKNGRIQEAEDAAAKARLLTWKKQLREGTGAAQPGLQVLDATPAESPPVMPLLPPRKPDPPSPPAKDPGPRT